MHRRVLRYSLNYQLQNDWTSLRMSLVLAAPLALGLVVGEIVHSRLPVRAFRPLVFSVLGVAGLVLAVRA